MTTTVFTKYQTAAELQEAVSKAPAGTLLPVATRGVAVVEVGANAYKRGFAMSVRMPDGGSYAVAGCTRAKDVSLDVMIAKAFRYIDDFLKGGAL